MVYILGAFAIVAISFLIMISIQLFRIEKTIADITETTEFTVKKMFEKET